MLSTCATKRRYLSTIASLLAYFYSPTTQVLSIRLQRKRGCGPPAGAGGGGRRRTLRHRSLPLAPARSRSLSLYEYSSACGYTAVWALDGPASSSAPAVGGCITSERCRARGLHWYGNLRVCVLVCLTVRSHCLPLVSQVRWCSSLEPGAGSAPGSLCGSPWQAARWRCATCGRTSSAPLRRHADRSVGILPSCVCVRRACVCVQSFPDTELMRQHRLDAISSSLAPSMWRTSRQSKSSAEAQPRSSGGSTASSIPWASWVTARGTFPSLAFSSSWEVKSRRGTGGLLR